MHIWEIKEKKDMQANCYEELGKLKQGKSGIWTRKELEYMEQGRYSSIWNSGKFRL